MPGLFDRELAFFVLETRETVAIRRLMVVPEFVEEITGPKRPGSARRVLPRIDRRLLITEQHLCLSSPGEIEWLVLDEADRP
jgi:hypothetical protein